MFCLPQVKLHYTEKALRLIAQKAMVKNTGARGLRAILETLLTDSMYEVSYPFVGYVHDSLFQHFLYPMNTATIFFLFVS